MTREPQKRAFSPLRAQNSRASRESVPVSRNWDLAAHSSFAVSIRVLVGLAVRVRMHYRGSGRQAWRSSAQDSTFNFTREEWHHQQCNRTQCTMYFSIHKGLYHTSTKIPLCARDAVTSHEHLESCKAQCVQNASRPASYSHLNLPSQGAPVTLIQAPAHIGSQDM